MKRRVAHLLDDFSIGGVTANLRTFEQPRLATLIENRTVHVMPRWALAPKLEADVIMTHFPPAWRTLPFLLSLRLRNRHATLVHAEHSYTGAWEALKVGNPRRFRVMLKLSYGLFDRVVAVSEGQAHWLKAIGAVSPHKLRVISSWSDNARLKTIPPVQTDPSRPVVIGACGRFAEQKGFDILIEAMKRVDPQCMTLLIGGFGPEEDALRQAAAGHPHIQFVGKVTDLAGFFQKIDAFIVPSRWEAFGLVAAEAKLAARAIVVANVDGLPEQVGAGGIVVDCSNPATLAEALVSFATMPFPMMGVFARASAQQAQLDRMAAWRGLFGACPMRPAPAAATVRKWHGLRIRSGSIPAR